MPVAVPIKVDAEPPSAARALVMLLVALIVIAVAVACVIAILRCRKRAANARRRSRSRSSSRPARSRAASPLPPLPILPPPALPTLAVNLVPHDATAVQCTRPLALNIKALISRAQTGEFRVFAGPTVAPGDLPLWTSSLVALAPPFTDVQLDTTIACPPAVVVVQLWATAPAPALLASLELAPQCGVGDSVMLEPDQGRTWVVFPPTGAYGGFPSIRVLAPPPVGAPETFAVQVLLDSGTTGTPDTSCAVTLANPNGFCVLAAGVVTFPLGNRSSTLVTVPLTTTPLGLTRLVTPGGPFHAIVQLTAPVPACAEADPLLVTIQRGRQIACTACETAPVFPVCPAIVPLGATAAGFGVLAGSAVTNTGPTIVTGAVGVAPGSAISGFPPGTTVPPLDLHSDDAAAAAAQVNLTAAFTNASTRAGAVVKATELGGTTLTCGVYKSNAGTFGITGTLTLDGQGDPNAVFIFQTASTLITAAGSQVVLINGATPCNIFWAVGSSATLGAGSLMQGAVLAQAAITANTGAVVNGWLQARTAAVTLDTAVVTAPTC